jgi:hypothetical protein
MDHSPYLPTAGRETPKNHASPFCPIKLLLLDLSNKLFRVRLHDSNKLFRVRLHDYITNMFSIESRFTNCIGNTYVSRSTSTFSGLSHLLTSSVSAILCWHSPHVLTPNSFAIGVPLSNGPRRCSKVSPVYLWHGALWNPMEHWSPMKPHGALWNPSVACGNFLACLSGFIGVDPGFGPSPSFCSRML